MPGPTTYAEWCNLLDNFAQGDDSAITELENGTFLIDAGTALRFYSRVEGVYKKRKQLWLDKFNRSLQLQAIKTESDFEVVLRNGKQNLVALSKFIALKGLPEDLKKTFRKDLEDFVGEIRKSLKDNVSKSFNGREKIIILLNTFGLSELPKEMPADAQNKRQPAQDIAPSPGRKIIF